MADTASPVSESELRTLFPQAPADLRAPTDVATLFRLRMRTFVRTHMTLLIALDGIALIVALACVGIGAVAGTIGTIILVLAFWLILVMVQSRKARADFFTRYAEARGLELALGCDVSTSSVPLLRKGDKRTFNQCMSGAIFGAEQASLANYTYTEITTDSDGSRSESDYRYLVLHVPLPAEVGARFDGVYLNPPGLTLGALQDKFASDRAVKLESTDFNKRYNLRVVDAQDDVALYELFSPPFIEALTRGPKVHWQQVGADLVFYRKHHETEAVDLDTFVAHAAPIVQRYREEWR